MPSLENNFKAVSHHPIIHFYCNSMPCCFISYIFLNNALLETIINVFTLVSGWRQEADGLQLYSDRISFTGKLFWNEEIQIFFQWHGYQNESYISIYLSNRCTKIIPAKDERIIASLSSRLGQWLWPGLMAPLQRQFTGKYLPVSVEPPKNAQDAKIMSSVKM